MRHFHTIAILFAVFFTPIHALAQGSAKPPKANPVAKTQGKTPPPNKEYVSSTKAIDAAGQKQINDFIADRAEQIINGDPKNVRQATNEVLALLRQSTATPIFWRACSESLKPFVTKIIATNDEFRISNLLQIIRWTRSPEALDILIEQATPAIQKDGVIRISASRLLSGCIASANLTAPQIDSAARRIREAAEAENNWIANVHDLQSLAAMSLASQGAQFSPQVKISRDEFLKVLAGTITKASKPNDSQEIFAVQRGMILLRDMLLNNSSPAEKSAVSASIRTITQSASQLGKQLGTSTTAADASIVQSAKSVEILAGVIDKLLSSTAAQPKSPS